MSVWAERKERLELSKVEAESSETQQPPSSCWVPSGGSTLAECSQVILKIVCKSEKPNGNKYTCYRCVSWFAPMSFSHPTVKVFASGYCCGLNMSSQSFSIPDPQNLKIYLLMVFGNRSLGK